MRRRHPTGTDLLDAVTRILQDARRADPLAGLWEAADLQWWWRLDQRTDPGRQAVWYDDDDVPVAATLFTRWRRAWGADVLGREQHTGEAWEWLAATLLDEPVEMLVADEPDSAERAVAAGFTAAEHTDRTGWMPTAARCGPRPVPSGFAVTSYDGGPHWMAGRNGERIAELMAQTSLYRPDLDLALIHGDEVAGYAMFWADPVTGVGMLEPMRIEEAYAGRGLGKVLIAEGLERLAGAGCTRLKVSWETGNTAAERLYTGAGFRPTSQSRLFTRG